MSVQKLWFFFLVVVIAGWAGVAPPNTIGEAEAQAPDLFPLAWIEQVTLVLEQRGDEADVYFPLPPGNHPPLEKDQLPIVAVLQGGQVDKGLYAEFGMQLARFGFVVVIPNHLQFLGPPGVPPLLLPDQFVVLDVLEQMKLEDADSASPLHRIVNTKRLGLVGHSVGGVVGLFVIEGSCVPPFCFDSFKRPKALKAGAFYGTNTCSSDGTVSDSRCIDESNPDGNLIDVETGKIPVALVQGSVDGLATPIEAEATFDILDGIRELITVDGANHYGICDVNNPPGAIPDFSIPTIDQEDAVLQVAQSMGLFLRTHVTGK